MNKFLLLFFSIVSVSFSQSLFPVSDDNGEARNRAYHVLHYKIEVSFDESKKMVFGKVTTTLVPFTAEFTSLDFDAENMNFKNVSLGQTALPFDSLAKTIRIHLDKTYSFRDTLTVSIEYSCIPQKGLYFIQPDSAYPDKPWQIWSQGEDMDNHFWFPCWDFPNDKATSEVIGTVRSNYTFLSNGKLLNMKEDKKAGTKTFHWKEEKPIASYLIMMAAGDYAILNDRADGIPVQYYVYKNQVDDARICLSHTPKMIEFFDEKIGYKFAWEKYAQVTVADFIYGGMENASATTMMDRILVFNARSRVDQSAVSLIAHELAHQWWGDVVTCKDWRHIWLNESFASYFDPLYIEHAFGEDEFINDMYGEQQAGIQSDMVRGRKPIVSVGSYVTNVYPRGASVLHMLRFLLGDDLFWRAMHHYIVKNQFTSVETNDLKNAIEEATGQNLYWFFDQWVYKAGHPKFDVSYSYSDSLKSLLLTVKQTQTIDSLTGVFRTPVDVEIVTGAESSVHRINIMNKESTFTIASAEIPKLVLFDKNDWLLKEVNYPGRSNEEWRYQAQFGSDVAARRSAVEHLAKSDTAGECIPLLATISTNDAFWGVRRAAVEGLGVIRKVTDEKTDALISALSDKKSSVRASAAAQLGNIRTQKVSEALHKALSDSSYSVEANSVTALSKVDSIIALAIVKSRLDVWSYGNQVGNAALNALAKLDSAQGIDVAMQKVKYGANAEGRGAAMGVLEKYGRHRDDVAAIFTSLLDDKSMRIKFGAANFLGEVGNESQLPGLENLAKKKDDPASGAAEQAIKKIKERSTK
ncbi:MAG: M1 family aminopeptidase [Bacteroidota bacterium]